MSEAWRTFYKSVSIDARYHPERCQFMPPGLKNLTELCGKPCRPAHRATLSAGEPRPRKHPRRCDDSPTS